MKIVGIYAAMPGYEQGLNVICKIIYNTFNELGVEVEEINLHSLGIDYYDGIMSQTVDKIFNSIKSSNGVIFASSAQRFSVCGIMQTFIEHFDSSVYGNILENKECFIVTSSNDGSEGFALDYLSRFISFSGGIDVAKMPVGQKYLAAINSDSIKEMIEKYAEDYYRMLRQNRKFFTMNLVNTAGDFKAVSSPKPQLNNEEQILKKINLDEFNERQEQDIDEITKLITSQYNNDLNEETEPAVEWNKQSVISNLYKENSKVIKDNVVPHIKTCKQRTQSLYHYFQPQLAKGLTAVIQIYVTGGEVFEGYLTIKDSECEYYDGVYAEPDVTIFADKDIWLSILNNKYTTQKAFMIGQIKVKGNFVLLSKFDQLFKIKP